MNIIKVSDHYYVNKMVERWALLLNGGAQDQASSFFSSLLSLGFTKNKHFPNTH